MVIAEKQLGIKLPLHAGGADTSPILGKAAWIWSLRARISACQGEHLSGVPTHPSGWRKDQMTSEITSSPAWFCENKTVPKGVAEAAACSGQRAEPSGAAAARSLEETALSNIMAWNDRWHLPPCHYSEEGSAHEGFLFCHPLLGRVGED